MHEEGIRSYALCVKVSWLTLCIDKVSIGSTLVDSVKLALETEKICLAQRPGLGYRQAIQLVADL